MVTYPHKRLKGEMGEICRGFTVEVTCTHGCLQVQRGETTPAFELRIHSKSGEILTGDFIAIPEVKNGKVVGKKNVDRYWLKEAKFGHKQPFSMLANQRTLTEKEFEEISDLLR